MSRNQVEFLFLHKIQSINLQSQKLQYERFNRFTSTFDDLFIIPLFSDV